ncbi:MAG: hypothetical protein Q9205_006502, partial [Flavoplaca limonia]
FGAVPEVEDEFGVRSADGDGVMRYVAGGEGGGGGVDVDREGVGVRPGGFVSGCDRDEMR